MNKIYLLPVLAGVVSLASGCATVTRGTTQSVGVNSEPTGAEVRVSNGMSCKAPCALELKRSAAHTLTAEKDGYEDQSKVLTPAINGGGTAGLAGNLLVGGIIGMAVDAGSGAMYDLSPGTVNFHMRKAVHEK